MKDIILPLAIISFPISTLLLVYFLVVFWMINDYEAMTKKIEGSSK